MGSLTRTQIVTAGLAVAGNTGSALEANTWLNAWLRNQATSWDWTALQRQISNIALGSGVPSLSFGAGSSGVTLEVQRVRDPILVYDSAYTVRRKARVRTINDPLLDEDETVNNPTTNKGTPTHVKVMPDETTQGKWTLFFTPIPDRAYLLKVFYVVIPADLTSDSQKPWYLNDQRMIDFITAMSWKRDDPGRHVSEMEEVWRGVTADRTRDAQDGHNNMVKLNSDVFRNEPSSGRNGPWNWWK